MKVITLTMTSIALTGVFLSAAQAEVTASSGAPYASLCQSRGVPLPPKWGETDPAKPKWLPNGTMSGTDVFIIPGVTAHSYYYANTQGVCMALPRYNAGESQAATFGVICQGSNGKVCFWDNAAPVTVNAPAVIASTNPADLTGSPFIGGAALVTATGGMCTDCHRGENAFIVVPSAATDLRPKGVNQFAGLWYEPIVGAGWLQNPGPGNIPSASSPVLGPPDGTCLQCHSAGGSGPAWGGRFPALGLLSEGGRPYYCSMVLDRARALRKMPPVAPVPPSDPGYQSYLTLMASYSKHWDALSAACNQPPPQMTTPQPPSRRHALDPALVQAALFPLL